MRRVSITYLVLAGIICVLIVIKSADYLSPDFTKGFLLGKSGIFKYYKFFLYAHILGAPIALLTGIFQFTRISKNWHKNIGKVYVVSVLLFAAPGGFGMALFALGGVFSIVNFVLLSCLWFYTTLNAYQKASKGAIPAHKVWITRSFILANSAVIIRLLSFANNHYYWMNQTEGYILISWLSWVPGLLIFELVQWSKRRKVVIF